MLCSYGVGWGHCGCNAEIALFRHPFATDVTTALELAIDQNRFA
jgi:hypothetical protein